ncbi:hydroxymethylglutaryl- synthase, cytoplasmic isoform X2 [Paramuricea clavata]|uniref:Hydroxymethylglutaryl-CoA synthase n=1 Tax=Paramuricea clavata TaxID=317549 RepID=A0A7D9E785_PARCT|nr:hydroxymethylglutaryl- synthase, cytoplasmic isoform X2 [Paramuricea clavata]
MNHVNGERSTWPENVGILAIEVYFPSTYVDQGKLEEYDGVSKGKYTIGLGQTGMGFCGDREDTNSLSLTVVQNLLEKNSIDPNQIGRLEVGTESILDKSKSVKTVLMQLFEQSGNSDIEGVDTINACYGSTQAFFNALDWVESSAWDGCVQLNQTDFLQFSNDLHHYCFAKPTAFVGFSWRRSSFYCCVVERGLRSVFMSHAYDFYKPNLESQYPVVDGKLSINCYLKAVERCYHGYLAKANSMDDIDYAVFHSPVCKLTQKSLARLIFLDFLREKSEVIESDTKYESLKEFSDVTVDQLYEDEARAKLIEKASMSFSLKDFQKKTKSSLLFATNVGNAYTASVYAGLASLLASVSSTDLAGCRIGVFCYGSGYASAFYSIKVSPDPHDSNLTRIITNVSDMKSKLEARACLEPAEFVKTLEMREKTQHRKDFSPSGSIEHFWQGTYFLQHVDDKYRRSYGRKTKDGIVDINGNDVVSVANGHA